jgi:hypothetical protein
MALRLLGECVLFRPDVGAWDHPHVNGHGPARLWHRVGDGKRGSLPAARMAARVRYLVGPPVISVLLLLAVAGCAVLGAAVGTSAALQRAGYHGVGVNIATGTGAPAGGLVQVSYSRGPTGNDEQDALQAERIVWDTLRYRFGALVIVKDSGGCAGPVCVSQSGEVARATYSQLAAKFGPRPPGVHATSAADAIRFPGWAVELAVVLAGAVMAAAAVVVWMILRSRHRSSRPTQTAASGPPGPPP